MPQPVSSFQQKFDVRIRRLLGVTDDSLPVIIETNTGDGYAGCETCGYGETAPIELRCGTASAEYSDLAQLIYDLGEVKL